MMFFPFFSLIAAGSALLLFAPWLQLAAATAASDDERRMRNESCTQNT
jgi:hypothetical protein